MKYLLVLALTLASSAAFARQSTTNLSCAEASALVDSSGAIVLSTGHPALFDRFVARASFCGATEFAAKAYVTTADAASCNIGFACVARESDGGNSISKTYPSTIRGCVNGQKGWAYETTPNDREIRVPAVCVNGKYRRVDGKDPVPNYNPRGCEEGRKGFVTKYTSNDREIRIPAVCRNGKYVPVL